MLSANALAKQLCCAWRTVRRAIAKGELLAQRENGRWVIDEINIAGFRERLATLAILRQTRRERMRFLWQSGKLQARKRKQREPIVVERLKRPTIVSVGQGIYGRTVTIIWQGDEGSFCCPSCATPLKVR